jgi:hypothetical protein
MRDRAPIILSLSLLLLSFPGVSPADPIPEITPEQAASDERLLKDFGLSADRSVLLRFFKFRILTDADRAELPKVVENLGSDSFDERELAHNKLLARGPSIRDLVAKNTDHRDPEVARRCRELLDILDHGPGPSLPSAAVRLLSRTPSNDVAGLLLDYLPFADDVTVADEILDGLVRLTKGTTPVLLREALRSDRDERRAAAAYVLGRSEKETERLTVVPLLSDKVVSVRYRAAQGLLAAKEPQAVPALIELLTTAPTGVLYRIEETLLNLAGTGCPQVSTGTGTADERARARTGWAAWWKANEGKIDLANASRPAEFLGLTVVPEMHANKVWECGRDGQPLWELAGLHCPIDAQVLPGNRVLVAELNGNRVTERDRTGKIFWEHKVNTPIACQRLPNGSTWISTNHRFFIVTPDGKEQTIYTPENGFFMHSVYRMRNGNVAVVSMAGEIREVTPAGAVIRTIPLEVQGSWSGISVAGNGHYLVVNNGQGLVQEIDQSGKVVWDLRQEGACYATRLPGGNTLVVSNRSGLIEVDRDGKTVWERKTNTSLWRGHRR